MPDPIPGPDPETGVIRVWFATGWAPDGVAVTVPDGAVGTPDAAEFAGDRLPTAVAVALTVGAVSAVAFLRVVIAKYENPGETLLK